VAADPLDTVGRPHLHPRVRPVVSAFRPITPSAAPDLDRGPGSAVNAWAGTVLALGAVLWAFGGTWWAMAGVWASSDTFGHGMLVGPIAAWLVLRRRALFETLRPRPDPVGLVAVAGAASAWAVADLAGVDVAAQYAAVMMIPAVIWTTAGRPVVKAFAFPLAFLLFMVPAGEWLNPALMDATADATVWALRASGLAVARDGLQFALPSGRWSVVEACSGLRYLLAAGVLATLFAALNFRRMRPRVLFVASAVALALLANWLRAYTVVMVGHLSGMRLAVGDDHVVYGWVFFGALMAGVAAMGLRWRDPPDAAEMNEPPRRRRRSRRARPVSVLEPLIAASLAIALMVGARVAVAHLGDVKWDPGFASRATQVLGDFRPGPLVLPHRFEGARGAVQGTLARSPAVEFQLSYFARQQAGHEMISWGNAVLPESDPVWTVMSRTETVARIGSVGLPITEWRIRSPGSERLVWAWYTVDGAATTRPHEAKLLAARGLLRGRGDHSTVAVLSTPIEGTGSNQVGLAGGVERARMRLEASAEPLSTFAREITTR